MIDQQVKIAKKQETNKNTQHTPHWGKDNGQKKCAHYKKKKSLSKLRTGTIEKPKCLFRYLNERWDTNNSELRKKKWRT